MKKRLALISICLFLSIPGQGFLCGFARATGFDRAFSMEQASKERTPLTRGTWGGNHIKLIAADDAVMLDFDCAHGRISQVVTADGEGKFTVKGVYVREGPGPIRVGRAPAELAVTYIGVTDGKTMTLTIKISDSDEIIGTYDLTHGNSGRIRKCK